MGKKIKDIPKNHVVLEVFTVEKDKQFKITRNINTNEYYLFAVIQNGGGFISISKGKNPSNLEQIALKYEWGTFLND